jgi:transposase
VFFQVAVNSTAAIIEEKYSSHSQSDDVNRPAAQVDFRIVHADKARPHTAAASQEFIEENGFERAIHPQYSPDLAPYDFYLFSHVKHCLRGQSFETADELFLAIDAILRGIQNWTVYETFLD